METVVKQQTGFKVGVQKFGRFLSGMVMPNIGAFIAWGLITALFIPTGWLPNENFAKLVGPMITYLLPLLIGFTGGKMIHGTRGGVIGAITTLGVIVGSDIPMFLGAMIVGPASAWVLKKFDQLVEGKIRSGFEMLVNNYSIGILGGAMSLIAFKGIGPIITGLSKAISSGVQSIIDAGLLPLANIFIEPGKILFLNNAINHGVLTPMGLEQATKTGKSIIFMLESNPGPGLGILLAYWFVGRGLVKQSAPGAAIIHFFGGIHEIYFPYILMNPKLILAAIAGGVSGTFTFSIFNAGLVASPSPGSIFAYIAMTPKGGLLPVFSGILVATAVSFFVSTLLLKTGKQNMDDSDIETATEKMRDLKGSNLAINNSVQPITQSYSSNQAVHKIVFACDAGMGSSAMGASLLRKKFKEAGIGITVINTAISELPADADLIITHKSLTERARVQKPNAEHISINDFLKSPEYAELVERFKSS
jgi:PTS system mannitol-specific IIC component